MPGNKPSSRQRPPSKEARKGHDHGFARLRMPPTQRVEHGVEVSPDCGTHLPGGWVQRTWEVIEAPVLPVEVTQPSLSPGLCGVLLWPRGWRQDGASPVVPADETGRRQDGAHGYVWTFSTPTERYFPRRGRDKGGVDEVLDQSFGGVLVRDFYAAYHHYPSLKQRFWAHLLGDLHDLKMLYPEDTGLAHWAEAVHQLYT
jgi:hypothetical protein